MAQELTEIFTGMPQGAEAIQDNFQKMNKKIGTFYPKSEDGVVYMNGAMKVDDYSGIYYQYIQGKNYKSVDLFINFKNITKNDIKIATIPSNIAPKDLLVLSNVNGNTEPYSIYVDRTNIILKIAKNGGTVNSTYSLQAHYLREDD